MTLEEKIDQLTQDAPPNERLGIPMMVYSEALHGLWEDGATNFPQAIALGSTWEPELIKQMTTLIAKEARAANISHCYSPNLDVITGDGRYGRVEESYGEDPHLVSLMGVAFIEGLQGTGDEKYGPDRVMATAKYFIGYPEKPTGINGAFSDMSERRLREVHLPPFAAAVQEAGVGCVMPGHQDFNGIPCHMNKWLIQDILRGELGFDGFIVSDNNDVLRLHSMNHMAKDRTSNGRLVSHTQTAYAIAISFDLIPFNLAGKSGDHFAENVSSFNHLTTGFLGTPLLCPALSKIGRDDLAYELLNRKEYPSWLYPVTMGATTIWERWDTQKPDGTIIEGMNSFNHYAYGAIGQWLYQHVAGMQIDPLNPGYKHIIFAPHPGGGLTSAKASLNTMYGMAESEWRIDNNTFYYKVTIPANTTASVYLPNENNPAILLNNEPLKLNKKDEKEMQKVELGSGIYYFEHSINEKNKIS